MIIRCLEKNAVHKITRRTDLAAWFFTPCQEWKKIHDAFGFALAHASRTTRVQIVSAVLMSNHYHIVAIDPECRLSEFLQILNSSFARFVNKVHGEFKDGKRVPRRGPVWAPTERCCIQPIMDCADIVEDVLYTLCNPTCEGGVYDPETWPGFITPMDKIGKGSIATTRPDGLVMPNDPDDEESKDFETSLELPLHVPDGLCHDTFHKDLALRRPIVLAERRKGVEKFMKPFHVKPPKNLIPKQAKRSRAPRFVCRNPERAKKIAAHFRAFHAFYVRARRQYMEEKRRHHLPPRYLRPPRAPQCQSPRTTRRYTTLPPMTGTVTNRLRSDACRWWRAGSARRFRNRAVTLTSPQLVTTTRSTPTRPPSDAPRRTRAPPSHHRASKVRVNRPSVPESAPELPEIGLRSPSRRLMGQSGRRFRPPWAVGSERSTSVGTGRKGNQARQDETGRFQVRLT